MSYSIDSSGVIYLDGAMPTLPASQRDRLLAIYDRIKSYVQSNSARTGITENWIMGIVWAETGFLGPVGGESAVSPAGAIGRMQLMPFWFSSPTAIGDGKAHSIDEMKNDALNIRFGTDLLKLIRDDGNDLIQTSSIYNCGSTTAKHPWHPNPSPPYVGRAAWGVCGEVASGGLSYQDAVAQASNSFLQARGTNVRQKPNFWFPAMAAASVAFAAYRLLR